MRLKFFVFSSSTFQIMSRRRRQGGKGLPLPSTALSGDSARTAFTYPQTEIAFNRRFDYNLLRRGEYPFYEKYKVFAPR